jgi:hypothetical protein
MAILVVEYCEIKFKMKFRVAVLGSSNMICYIKNIMNIDKEMRNTSVLDCNLAWFSVNYVVTRIADGRTIGRND